MRYLALALDYDGTGASDGKLSDAASSAIERLRTSGRRVVLVTGRRVGDLLQAYLRGSGSCAGRMLAYSYSAFRSVTYQPVDQFWSTG